MKTNDSMLGGSTGTIDSSDYGVLAQYFVKFLEAYKAAGVNIWAVTPQNEPSNAPTSYSGMLFPASDEATFIADASPRRCPRPGSARGSWAATT